MADPNGKKGGNAGAAPPKVTTAPHNSGRATFDSRGVAIWEWQVETGAFDLNADSQRVKALTDVALSIEEPTPPKKPGYRKEGFNPYAEPEPPGRLGGGSNPYATGAKQPERVSYDPHRPPPAAPAPAQPRRTVPASRPEPVEEAPKKSLFGSLFGRDHKK